MLYKAYLENLERGFGNLLCSSLKGNWLVLDIKILKYMCKFKIFSQLL
jgi:hypothetical protein